MTLSILLTVKRNQRGDDRLYVTKANPGYKLLMGLYKNNTEHDVDVPISIQGVQGVVLVADECVKIGKYVKLRTIFLCSQQITLIVLQISGITDHWIACGR